MFRRFSAAAAASSIWFQSAFFGQTELGAPVECGRAICALMTDSPFGVAEDAANDVGSCAGCSGDFLPPSPPAEKTAAHGLYFARVLHAAVCWVVRAKAEDCQAHGYKRRLLCPSK
jgi:hypothetical protein